MCRHSNEHAIKLANTIAPLLLRLQNGVWWGCEVSSWSLSTWVCDVGHKSCYRRFLIWELWNLCPCIISSLQRNIIQSLIILHIPETRNIQSGSCSQRLRCASSSSRWHLSFWTLPAKTNPSSSIEGDTWMERRVASGSRTPAALICMLMRRIAFWWNASFPHLHNATPSTVTSDRFNLKYFGVLWILFFPVQDKNSMLRSKYLLLYPASSSINASRMPLFCIYWCDEVDSSSTSRLVHLFCAPRAVPAPMATVAFLFRRGVAGPRNAPKKKKKRFHIFQPIFNYSLTAELKRQPPPLPQQMHCVAAF